MRRTMPVNQALNGKKAPKSLQCSNRDSPFLAASDSQGFYSGCEKNRLAGPIHRCAPFPIALAFHL
jgi:hypothetical protein